MRFCSTDSTTAVFHQRPPRGSGCNRRSLFLRSVAFQLLRLLTRGRSGSDSESLPDRPRVNRRNNWNATDRRNKLRRLHPDPLGGRWWNTAVVLSVEQKRITDSRGD